MSESGDRVRLLGWPQADPPPPRQTRAGLSSDGVKELVGGPWGGRAPSTNTKGRWGAPGEVPQWGHNTVLW